MEDNTLVDSSFTARIDAGDMRVVKVDDSTCELTNTVHSSATPELLDFIGEQGIPWDVFRVGRQPISEAHNRQETPLFAKSIERHALRAK